MKPLFYLSLLIAAACELEALTCDQIRTFVDGHNARRFKLAKGEVEGQPAAFNMNYMMWDQELQAKASQWAAKNIHKHNLVQKLPSNRFTTGENLFWSSSNNQNYVLDLNQVLDAWFDEHTNFTFGPISKSSILRRYPTGHYTQMAWADTMFVGCDILETTQYKSKSYYVVCNYGPAGNYRGQTPYQTDKKKPHLMCACRKYDKNCNCNVPYTKYCAEL